MAISLKELDQIMADPVDATAYAVDTRSSWLGAEEEGRKTGQTRLQPL